jgi:PilZ domain-containing protein
MSIDSFRVSGDHTMRLAEHPVLPKGRVPRGHRSKRDGHAGQRRHLRFPISMAVEYTFDGCKGTAVTGNIGSGGLFLRTWTNLPAGKRIELSIEWPAPLAGYVPMTLHATGLVVRNHPDGAAIRFFRYEFRLRGTLAIPSRSAATSGNSR